MEILLALVIGYFVGKAHAYYTLARAFRDIAEENGIDLEKDWLSEKVEETTQVYKLKVETHGDMLYLFDKETDSFVCQGSTVQELATLAQKNKNIAYAAVLHGDKIFTFQDGKSIEV